MHGIANGNVLAHHPPGRGGVGASHPNAPLGVEQSHPPGQPPPDNLPHLAVPAQQTAAVSGGHVAPEQDVHLLNQLQGMAERLNRADVEAHEAAEAALEKARAQVGLVVIHAVSTLELY